MKTLFLFIDEKYNTHFFFEVEGDGYPHLDQLSLRACSELSSKLDLRCLKELENLMFEDGVLDGDLKVKKLMAPTKDWDYFVTVYGE